jgi:hypothetical protein
MGFYCLMDALDAHAKPIKTAQAMPGDIALLPQAPIDCVGVVVGAEALFLTSGGMLRYPLADLHVWRAI